MGNKEISLKMVPQEVLYTLKMYMLKKYPQLMEDDVTLLRSYLSENGSFEWVYKIDEE